MKIETSVQGLRTQLQLLHPHCTALVPTMGNLHAGHIFLVEKANSLADRVVASIFINPLQFGPNEDYHSYPRSFEQDSEKLEQAGVDVLFAPTVEEMYPRGLEHGSRVSVPSALSGILCGASRPGHFTGVATVVNMLFNVVQPNIALFGEKDYQQLRIIQRMVSDLHIAVEIVGVPTQREEDGLALSSRNKYLSAEQRDIAPRLYSLLRALADRLRAGERDYPRLERETLDRLAGQGFKPDYVAIRRESDLMPPGEDDTQFRLFVAAWLGQARLIDNLAVDLEQ